jgi:hypothetical protein
LGTWTKIKQIGAYFGIKSLILTPIAYQVGYLKGSLEYREIKTEVYIMDKSEINKELKLQNNRGETLEYELLNTNNDKKINNNKDKLSELEKIFEKD